jgi:hypothetical protein
MDGYPALGLIEKPATLRAISRPSHQALLVLGMSRSGTSLLTQVLHALGATLPSDLMGPAHGNPFGHFEPSGLVALNDRILEALDRPWNDPRPIAPRWFRSRPAYAFLRRISAQIGDSYGDASLLVLKDPRLCRLLPLYLDALDLLDTEPLVILQVRPAQEVVQSLGDRDDMRPDLAEFLWLRSVVEAEWHSRSCRRVWVSMAEILADWPGTVRRIADGLHLDWAGVDLSAVGSRVRPRLRHHVAAAGAADGSGTLSVAAWTAIERGLAGDEAAARAGFDAVRTSLQDLDRLYAPILPEAAGNKRRTLQRLLAPLRAVRRQARDALPG